MYLLLKKAGTEVIRSGANVSPVQSDAPSGGRGANGNGTRGRGSVGAFSLTRLRVMESPRLMIAKLPKRIMCAVCPFLSRCVLEPQEAARVQRDRIAERSRRFHM